MSAIGYWQISCCKIRIGENMNATVLIDNVSDNGLVGEWGLAVEIEYNGHPILLDTGSSEKFTENAAALGVELANVEYGVLSHAHYDHSDGLAAFFEKNKKASFYLRKGSAENCYMGKGEGSKYIGVHRGFLDQYRDRLMYVEGDHELLPGVWLIPHKTKGLELQGEKSNMYIRIGESWYPDNFQHEQSLVCETDKGLVIFNSCSHGGADNIIREIEETFPEKKIYALVGGLHLFEKSPEEVRVLAGRIRETGIAKIVTGHCTGEGALHILKEELGDIVENLYTGKQMHY